MTFYKLDVRVTLVSELPEINLRVLEFFDIFSNKFFVDVELIAQAVEFANVRLCDLRELDNPIGTEVPETLILIHIAVDIHGSSHSVLHVVLVVRLENKSCSAV